MKPNTRFPLNLVFTPEWWHKAMGIIFDWDFFFDSRLRIECEQEMTRYLYERFGDVGLGEKDPAVIPALGSAHLSAGFFMSALLGCDVRFSGSGAPSVVCANMDEDAIDKLMVVDVAASSHPMAKALRKLAEDLKSRFGYVTGDINLGGIQNLALDLRGNTLFLDYFDRREETHLFLKKIAASIEMLLLYISSLSKSLSISVNPAVRHFNTPITLISNCSISMVSPDIYDKFILPYDKVLASRFSPFGIHHCGPRLEEYIKLYEQCGEVVFYDVGDNSDVAKCRLAAPDKFFNLRLSPVKLMAANPDYIPVIVESLVSQNGGIQNAGICCINMDADMPDENIRTLCKAVERVRSGIPSE